MNTKTRVAIATNLHFADAIPDRLYCIMGRLLAGYWESLVLEPNRFESLEWIFRDVGTFAAAKAISESDATGLVRAFLGELTLRGYPLPANAREIAHGWLEHGRGANAAEVLNELKPHADPYFRPSNATHQGAPFSPNNTTAPGAPAPPPSSFQPTPFVLQDPATIPRRDWLYGTSLIRKELSATLAPGGVGKTALGVVEALAMATGRPLLGVHVAKPLRVWLWNGEEPQEELMRRIHAACLHHNITAADIGDRLWVDNGHDMPLVLAAQTRDGTTVYEPVVDGLVDALQERSIDVGLLDPFVSTHNVTENDNNAIQKAATGWKTVAVRANIGLGLAHHTRKLGGRDATAEDARGADALVAKCRDVRALNPMSEAEARALGVPPLERFSHFWTGGAGAKVNMSPRTGRKVWFHMVSVGLGNGRGLNEPEDRIGVVESWTPDYSADALAPEGIEKLGVIMAGKPWRAANQKPKDAANWIVFAVSEAFGLEPGEGSIGEAKRLVRRLEAEGFLARVEVANDHRKAVPMFVFKAPDAAEQEGDEEAA